MNVFFIFYFDSSSISSFYALSNSIDRISRMNVFSNIFLELNFGSDKTNVWNWFKIHETVYSFRLSGALKDRAPSVPQSLRAFSYATEANVVKVIHPASRVSYSIPYYHYYYFINRYSLCYLHSFHFAFIDLILSSIFLCSVDFPLVSRLTVSSLLDIYRSSRWKTV